MKVKDLIAKLTECDGEADVIIYCEDSEDAGKARRVFMMEAGSKLYTKGDTVTETAWPSKNYIVIG